MRRLTQVLRGAATVAKVDRVVDDIKVNQGRILAELQASKAPFNLLDYEFRVFSQWGEDGILQFLVRELAVSNRCFIEFGVARPTTAT